MQEHRLALGMENAPEPACIGVRPSAKKKHIEVGRCPGLGRNRPPPPPGEHPKEPAHQPICSLARPPRQIVAAARQPLNLGDEGGGVSRGGGRGRR